MFAKLGKYYYNYTNLMFEGIVKIEIITAKKKIFN